MANDTRRSSFNFQQPVGLFPNAALQYLFGYGFVTPQHGFIRNMLQRGSLPASKPASKSAYVDNSTRCLGGNGLGDNSAERFYCAEIAISLDFNRGQRREMMFDTVGRDSGRDYRSI